MHKITNNAAFARRQLMAAYRDVILGDHRRAMRLPPEVNQPCYLRTRSRAASPNPCMVKPLGLACILLSLIDGFGGSRLPACGFWFRWLEHTFSAFPETQRP